MYRQIRPLTVALMLAVSLQGAVAVAAPGDVDTTFGTSGSVTIPSNGNLSATPDGRLLLSQVIGSGNVPLKLGVRRYLANGQLDAGWGVAGEAQIDPTAYLTGRGRSGCTGGGTATLRAATDGKVAASFFVRCSGDVGEQLIIRLRADGSLDPAFGAGGFASLVDSSNKALNAEIIGLSADGSVWAGEWSYDDFSSTLFAAHRISATGSIASVRTDASYFDAGELAVTQALPDGRLVIAADDKIMRLMIDGTPDATYGVAGASSFFDANGRPTGVGAAIVAAAGSTAGPGLRFGNAAIAADGSVVLALMTGDKVALARITRDGQFDSTFGTGGVALMDSSSAPWASLAIDNWRLSRLLMSTTGELTLEGAVKSSASASRRVTYGYLWRRTANGQAPTAPGLAGIQVLDEIPVDGCCSPTVTLQAAQSGHDVLIADTSRVFRLSASAAPSPGVLTMGETFSVDEGATAQIPVWRTAGSSGAASLSYSTSSTGISPPATAGSDYVATSGRLDWASGESGVKYISVTTLSNAQVLAARYFVVNVTNVSGVAGPTARGSQAAIEVRNTTVAPPTQPTPTPTPPATGSSATSGGGGGGGALDWTVLLVLALCAFGAARRSRRAPDLADTRCSSGTDRLPAE